MAVHCSSNIALPCIMSTNKELHCIAGGVSHCHAAQVSSNAPVFRCWLSVLTSMTILIGLSPSLTEDNKLFVVHSVADGGTAHNW